MWINVCLGEFMCTMCVQMPSETRWGYPVPLEVELQTIVSCLMWPNKHFSFAHTEATNAPDLWDPACSLAAAHRYASPNGTCEKSPLGPTQGSAHGQTTAHTSTPWTGNSGSGKFHVSDWPSLSLWSWLPPWFLWPVFFIAQAVHVNLLKLVRDCFPV